MTPPTKCDREIALLYPEINTAVIKPFQWILVQLLRRLNLQVECNMVLVEYLDQIQLLTKR